MILYKFVPLYQAVLGQRNKFIQNYDYRISNLVFCNYMKLLRKGGAYMTYQLAAPLLDACVLGIVEMEDVYGYTLTQRVKEIVDISESTLYPVLRRLQKENYLTIYDQPFQGRNRRYYKITKEGMDKLTFYKEEWESYKTKVDTLLGGGLRES